MNVTDYAPSDFVPFAVLVLLFLAVGIVGAVMADRAEKRDRAESTRNAARFRDNAAATRNKQAYGSLSANSLR